MPATQTFIGTLVIENCCKCGVPFGMTTELYNRLRDLGSDGSFYCPNGHSQHYQFKRGNDLESQLEVKRKEIESLSRVIENKNSTIRQKENSLRAERAAKTRIKNRVKNGTCPCCNRHFENLASHFKTMHPEESPTKILAPIHGKINKKYKRSNEI